MPRKENFQLSRLDQIRALRSGERARIVQSLSLHGPSSVRDLATRMGRIPESLYYHVSELVRVGLVHRVGTRPTRNRKEALYDRVGPIAIDPSQRSPAFLEAVGELYQSSLRATGRQLTRSLEEEHGRTGERVRQGLVQHSARLSPKAHRELRKRLDELIDFVIENEDPDEPEVTWVTFAYAATSDRRPVEASPEE